MRLNFLDLSEEFSEKGLILNKLKKGYEVLVESEYIKFANLAEASEWLELIKDSEELEVLEMLEEIQQTAEETVEHEDMQDSPNIQSESIYQQIHETFVPEQLPYTDKEVIKKLLAKHFYCVGYSDDAGEYPETSEYQPDFTTAENVGSIYGWNILTNDVAIFAEIDGFYYGKFVGDDENLRPKVLKTFIKNSIDELATLKNQEAFIEKVTILEKINPLVIEFSQIKKAVNFFSHFREKNQNTIKIDNQGFYYLDNWYSVYIDIQNEIILNFDNLKDFADIFPGSDDSKILLDVENSLIKNGNFQYSIAIKTATETYENYNISDFNYLTQIKSDVISKVLSAASIDKREKELQVLNFKFTNTDLKVACTDSSQIFSYKLEADLDNFDSLRNIDLQISSDIAKKFSKLASVIDVLHFDNVICIVADSCYKFIVQDEREFFDYSSFIFENIDISWYTKFLNPLFQFLKKLKKRQEYAVRFTNQGSNCLFEVVSNQGVVYSGKFLQKDCRFLEFSITADLFHNLLANIQEFSRLTIHLNDEYLVAKVLDSRYDFILNLMN